MPSSSDTYQSDCPFCNISQTYPPISPQSIPKPSPESKSSSTSSNILPGPETAYTVLSTPTVMAFLDHMPITRGHVLVTTRPHRHKLSHVTIPEAAIMGAWLPLISRAVMAAVGGIVDREPVQDWNVVQNNGARAAQVVDHVHWHILPRPGEVPDIKGRSWIMYGRGQRGDLDEEEAVIVRDRIRLEIKNEVDRLSAADRRVLGIDDGAKL